MSDTLTSFILRGVSVSKNERCQHALTSFILRGESGSKNERRQHALTSFILRGVSVSKNERREHASKILLVGIAVTYSSFYPERNLPPLALLAFQIFKCNRTLTQICRRFQLYRNFFVGKEANVPIS